MSTLIKPVLFNVSTFDAQYEFAFTFSYLGNIVVANTLLIKDNETNQEVYRQTIQTRQLKHIVPANTLTNGKTYNVSIQITDTEGDTSNFSDVILIKCLSTPSFYFQNLSEGQTINRSNYELILNYSQLEGEILNQYNIALYTSNRVEIYNTGDLYNVENLQVVISNLEDSSFYFARALGRTINGIEVDTGYIFFNVEYINPPVFSLLGLENQPEIGAVSISPNLVVIEGSSNPSPPIFLNDTEVDLREDGAYVKFENFNIDNDFTLQMIGRDFNDFKDIIIFSNNVNTINIKYKKGWFNGSNEIAYFELKAFNGLTNYVLTSNYIKVPISSEYVYVFVRKIRGNFTLKTEIL